MNFHAKALLAFLAFHVIVTGGGLLFDQVPQALGQGVNDAQLLGAVLWGLWCLTLSMGALGMAYLSRAAWKIGRGLKTLDRRPVRGSVGDF
jgi:hypothetical protein